ncbi:MAG: alpha/beta hydrolase [Paludibacter sp.]
MSKIKHNSKKIKSGFLGLLVLLSISFMGTNVSAQKSDTIKVGTTSWVCPAGVYSVQIECWGGGGAGGGGASGGTGKAGGGGAGGSYVKNTSVTVVPGTTYSVTVGAGGAPGGTTSSVLPTPGGNSTFTVDGTTSITAVGGLAGKWGSSGTPSATVPGSNVGNIGFEGSFNYAGGDGIAGAVYASVVMFSGGGGAGAGSLGIGASGFGTNPAAESIGTGGGGNGAAGVIVANSNGLPGKVPGGGGSGGFGGTAAKPGGAGGDGRILLTYSSGPAIPKWTAGWPTVSALSFTSFIAKVNINVAGNVYFVVLPAGAIAPTSAQVKTGKDASGTPVISTLAGTIACISAATEYSASITGLSESTSYDVYFVAEDNVPTLQATPILLNISFGSSSKLNQVITFPSIPNGTVGDQDFNPGAAASSDLVISLVSSNTAVATIVGGNIHIVGIGNTTITASQAGDAIYNAAVSASQPFTVVAASKQNQTITFPALASVKVGDADFSPGATSDSGLPVTYTSSNTSVVTIVNGNIHILSAGVSKITASQAGNATYNAAADFAQDLVVSLASKLNQTITFPVIPTKNIGNADFSPGATTDAIAAAVNDPNLFLNASRFSTVSISTVQYATVTNSSGSQQNLSLDIYQPTGDVSINRPCMLWIHGGSFTSNTKSSQSYIVNYATAFAKRGFVCISIDYRLRSSATTLALKWPALQDAARDGNTALDWIRAHAATYGIDVNSLFICGGSAGGQAAVSLAQFTGPDTSAKYAPETAYLTKPWNKTGIIACGMFWGAEELELRGWTYPYLTATSIPTIQIHGSADTTIPVQNAYDLQTAFNAVGTTNELHVIAGAAHSPSGTSYDPNNLLWSGNFFVSEWKKVLPSGTYSITYTSSNPSVATIVNGNIHIAGNGTTTITATQAGDATYNAAQQSQTLTVGSTGITAVANNERNVSIFSVVSAMQPIQLGLSGYTEKEVVVSISSLQGQQLCSRTYPVEPILQLNPTQVLAGGTYLINVRSGASNITKKLIVK